MLRRCFKNERGSVLLVVPVFFLALAVFMGATIQQAETKSFYSEVRTETKMERIQKALAIHAHRYYRIPCPADPTLDPVGNAANFGSERAGGCTTVATQTGIVPFRELGLTEFDIRDQWGNYFTYAVSPAFTRTPVVEGRIPAWQYTDDAGPAIPLPVPYSSNPNDINPATSITVNPSSSPGVPALNGADVAQTFVHKYCRQEANWVQPRTSLHRGPDGTQYTLDNFVLDALGNPDMGVTMFRTFNKNNYKAQFCCAANAQSFTTETFSAEDYIDDLRAGDVYTYDNPKTFTPPSGSPGDDITFRGGGAQWSGATWVTPETRSPGTLRLTYGDRMHGVKGGLGLGGSGGAVLVDVDGDGAYDFSGVDKFQQKMYGHETLFMDFNTSIKQRTGATMILGDLEGEEPDRQLVYSVELYDVVSGNTLVNAAYDPSDPDSVKDDYPAHANLEAANYNTNLFHASQKMINKSVGGIGRFEVSVYDFKKQIEALGYNPDNIRLKKLQLHIGDAASAISTQLVGLELTSPQPANSSDLVIEREGGINTALPPRDTGGYRPGDEIVPANSVTAGFEAPAYSLVSHGENGIGAFIVGTTGPSGSAEQVGYNGAWQNGIGDGELENANNILNGDRNFRAQRRVISNDNQNFDDIVKWDTQMSLYNVLPNGTCERAQAEVN